MTSTNATQNQPIPLQEGQVQVFGFNIKLRVLYGAGINPKVYNDSTLAETLSINREAVRQIKGKERPSTTEAPALDGSNTVMTLTQSRLASICNVFGIPLSWFKDKISKKDFERRLMAGTWTRLLDLTTKSPAANFEILASGNRGLKPASVVENKVELESFNLATTLEIQLMGEKYWNIILLERLPNGHLLSLLPSEWSSHCKLNDQGYLSLPNLKFEKNDVGQHTFVSIFHEKPFFEVEADPKWFYTQLASENEVYEPERSDAVLRKLVNWLEDQKQFKPSTFEVVVKECLVVTN